MCEELHTLPYPGGLYDQDPFFVEVYLMTKRLLAQKQELDRGKKG